MPNLDPLASPASSLRRPAAPAVVLLILVAAAITAVPGAADEPAPSHTAAPHELLHATLWMQRSAEYRAICLQTFQWGKALVDQGLSDNSWHAALEEDTGPSDKPTAIIVDVDETLLDNSFYEARLVRDEQEYSSKSWDPWVHEESAPALPGAVDFCRYVHEKGVTVFYLTNRKAHLTEATRHNLAVRGFPMRPGVDPMLTRTDDKDKGARRRSVAADYRVLLLVGDNVGDFASTFGESDIALRAAKTDEYRALWGSRWLMLPNPAYGSWEGAILDGDYRVSRAQKLARKRAALLFDPVVGPDEPREHF
ncbi:MAG: HAD family acid phosphatase [Planctomycetota bacterium]